MSFQALLLHFICVIFFIQISEVSPENINSKNGIGSQKSIIGPYSSTEKSNYIELVLVVDNKVFKSFDKDTQKVHKFSKDLINHVSALFTPLNISIALTDVVIWTEQDQIKILAEGDETLKNFLVYRRESLVVEHPNDFAVLLTGQHFNDGFKRTLKGPVCSYEFSGTVVNFHTKNIKVLSTTISHAIGHILGMECDNDYNCTCPDERCIMSTGLSKDGYKHWSSCSIDELNLSFHRGMNSCLKNLPKKLFGSPTCGNGFVEKGEECDCGLPDQCKHNCCDPNTCKLRANATCATENCCDLDTCTPKNAGILCREVSSECDLHEYCSGSSEFCPEDNFIRDTKECANGTAYCYQGSCNSHNSQCQLLWGPSGKSSENCYFKNANGTRHGNCGYNMLDRVHVPCKQEDVMCGMLHCQHFNDQLEFGMQMTSILSHSFVEKYGEIYPCRTAILDFGLDTIDPGLVPNGAKCGDNKMCINQKCMPIEKLKEEGKVPECRGCDENEVCDSKGECQMVNVEDVDSIGSV